VTMRAGLLLVGLLHPVILSVGPGFSLAWAQSPTTGFHHLHLNSVNPDKAIAWYLETFPVTSRARVSGLDGIRSEKIHVLFTPTSTPPNAELDSPIWHFGWGSPDMAADFEMHQARGVRFLTPLSTLAQGTVFAYMQAPDGALVEINSAKTRAFVHVHLYSEHPLCAADWYVRHLGGVRRPSTQVTNRSGRPEALEGRAAPPAGPCEVPYGAPSEPLGVIRSPAATVRFDDISLIIYPRQRPGRLVSSSGHVADHIGLSVSDLPGTLARLESAGVKILQGVHPFGRSGSERARAAFIEGPDAIVIELVEQP
jgi:catechol 2,3-dioxygenase-like lactoylglutathione lyase family enzyme